VSRILKIDIDYLRRSMLIRQVAVNPDSQFRLLTQLLLPSRPIKVADDDLALARSALSAILEGGSREYDSHGATVQNWTAFPVSQRLPYAELEDLGGAV
jgi:hypothetical protein